MNEIEPIEELKSRIRPVTEADKDLPRFSYSRLDVYKNCPRNYWYKYIEKKRTEDTTLTLELGGLLHKVLELKGKMVVAQQKIDYDYLLDVLQNGCEDEDGKIPGVGELRKRYFEEWFVADNASGMTYEEKIKLFIDTLKDDMTENGKWQPQYLELNFEFVYNNKVQIIGFIDRVDMNSNGEYRAVDYKSSKKIYPDNKLATSLQFGVYALAILNQFGKLPVESQYDFIVLGEKQYALTKGWEKRLIKTLDRVFEQIETCAASGVFPPKGSALCHWCDYCKTNPRATIFREECEYHLLWTPTDKNWAAAKKWNALDVGNGKGNESKIKEKRKLIF